MSDDLGVRQLAAVTVSLSEPVTPGRAHRPATPLIEDRGGDDEVAILVVERIA